MKRVKPEDLPDHIYQNQYDVKKKLLEIIKECKDKNVLMNALVASVSLVILQMSPKDEYEKDIEIVADLIRSHLKQLNESLGRE